MFHARYTIGAFAFAAALGAGPAASDTAVVFAVQGEAWTPELRKEFYFTDQGSRIMPLNWIRALTLPGGEGFLHDGLERYGYLPDQAAPAPDIPVGFTVADTKDGPMIGMTCAACHTRQIEVEGMFFRIDGGPAMVDFQSLLADLDVAMGDTLASDEAFDAFASRVLDPTADDTKRSKLREEAALWYERFHTLIERALPDPAWGPGRLDAVSMIFNRLAGLDIGEPPSRLITGNVHPADAPTRYPFLWNAARQDKTQWPGFAGNGNDLLGLARNLGEVYGVFGDFQPLKQGGLFKLDRDYISHNSANFDGLKDLEDLIWKIGAPKWPWFLDEDLVAQGKAIFGRAPAQGGCADCHSVRTGAFRSIFHRTWLTPVQDVGTDTRECAILSRTIDTGVLSGAQIPFGGRLKPTDTAFNALRTSVIGAIIQHGLGNRSELEAVAQEGSDELPPEFDDLRDAFPSPEEMAGLMESEDDGGCAYEARVLHGIWATAPYLHNGSVASLADLLKPASEREASFQLGPSYDRKTVGLAEQQPRFNYTLQTTDCEDIDSGNSRCGHEYGKALRGNDRQALLEYLKSL